MQQVLFFLCLFLFALVHSQSNCQTLYSFESDTANWSYAEYATSLTQATSYATEGTKSIKGGFNAGYSGSKAIFKSNGVINVSGYRYIQFDLTNVGGLTQIGFVVESNTWTEATPVNAISGQATYTFDLLATTWKTDASGWQNTVAVSSLDSIQRIAIVLYSTTGTNFIYFDNVRKCLAGAPPSQSATRSPVSASNSPSRSPVSSTPSRTRSPVSVTSTPTKTRSPATLSNTPTRSPVSITPSRTRSPVTLTSTPTKTRSPVTLSNTPTRSPVSKTPSRTGTPVASNSPSSTPISVSTGTSPGAGFVYACGRAFCKDNCKFYFAGTNLYYLIYQPNSLVTTALDTASSIGANVVRTWAFLEGGYLRAYDYNGYWLQKTSTTGYGDPIINYGDYGLNHLDDVIFLAKQRNIKLILTLSDNWRSFGGIDQYAQWWGLDKHDAFFTDYRVKGSYKRWVSTVLNRVNHNYNDGIAYKDDPTILAWELINEPRCAGSGLYYTSGSCTPQTISDWVLEMSNYVRSIDSKHLIGVGDEGFFNRHSSSDWTYNAGDVGGGVDFDAYLNFPNINFGTYHVYPDAWSIADPINWTVQWINDHAASGAAANKPVILEEYGWYNDGNRVNYYNTWLNAVLNSGNAGSNFWMLGVSGSPGDSYNIFSTDPAITSSFNNHKNAMNAKNTCP